MRSLPKKLQRVTKVNIQKDQGSKKITKPSKSFNCNQCKKSYANKNRLSEHIRVIHQGLRYYCSTCNKEFKDQSNMAVHQRLHQNEKPYQCRYCPKTFTSGGNKADHERRHTDRKPFQCDLCSKSYFRKYLLVNHLNKHQTDQNSFSQSIENSTIASNTNEEIKHLESEQDQVNENTQTLILNKENSIVVTKSSYDRDRDSPKRFPTIQQESYQINKASQPDNKQFQKFQQQQINPLEPLQHVSSYRHFKQERPLQIVKPQPLYGANLSFNYNIQMRQPIFIYDFSQLNILTASSCATFLPTLNRFQ